MTYSFAAGRSDGTMIGTLVGPLTLSTMFSIQDELRSMKPEVMILDLSGVPYMDSAGLGMIMNSYVSAGNNGRKLLLAGVNERVAALLEMTKVDKILRIFPAADEAEASL